MRNKQLHGMLLAVMAASLTTGCATQPNTVVTYEPKIVAADDSQLVDCEVSPPPSKKDYMASVMATGVDDVSQLRAALATEQERSRLALKWAGQQTQNLTECNVRLKGLRTHKAQTIREIEALTKSRGHDAPH